MTFDQLLASVERLGNSFAAGVHTSHGPAAYRTKAIGDFLLNYRLPPIDSKI